VKGPPRAKSVIGWSSLFEVFDAVQYRLVTDTGGQTLEACKLAICMYSSAFRIFSRSDWGDFVGWFQLVRFTPPRDVTPPRVVQDDYKSVQTITLSMSSSSSTQQCSPEGGSSASPVTAAEEVPAATRKSSTTLVLRSN